MAKRREMASQELEEKESIVNREANVVIAARRRCRRSSLLVAASAVLIASLASAFTPLSASGSTVPQALWTRCAADADTDIQCSLPRGIATAPASAGVGVAGNIYVGDQQGKRVVEFSPFGVFIRTFGWKVNKTKVDASAPEAQQNICPVDPGDVCQPGIDARGAEAGAGRFGSTQGIAADSGGNVYVVDRPNNRVEKFDPQGHFLLMWGKGVNAGTAVNKEICTNAGPPEQVCKAGEEGGGPGQFGLWTILGSYVAIDTRNTPSVSDDKVYVGDQGRIQLFNASGQYQSDLPNPEGVLTGKTVSSLAVVPTGNLFVAREGTANVLKLNATSGAKECEALVNSPTAVAADAAGNAYVVDENTGRSVRKFGSTCKEVVEENSVFPFFPTFPFLSGFQNSTGIATGAACVSAPKFDLYVSNARESPNGFIRAFGPPPDKAHAALCPTPPRAPEIEDQGAVSVSTDSAEVQATINPQFWEDTSYYLQYGTTECVENEPLGWDAACISKKPAAPLQLEAGVTDIGVKTSRLLLAGLLPGTEYSYRFVAQSRLDRNGTEVNPKGGPVYGEGGTEGLEGKAGSFTTVLLPVSPETACVNQEQRIGAGAFLPDCRAYELVSPIHKNGGDVRGGGSGENYVQVSSPNGNRITYTSDTAFGDQASGKIYNQYLSTRSQTSGWLTRGINAPLGRQLESPLIGREGGPFSADLCSEWLPDRNVFPLSSAAPQGYANLYRQDLCGGEGFEAFITATPGAGAEPAQYVGADSVQGFSADLSKVFFVARAPLTADAVPGTTNRQIYERSERELHLVSVLPNGSPDPGQLNAGATVGGGVVGLSRGSLSNAVSSDGSKVFWTSATNNGKGTLYLREHPEQGIVPGECSEPAAACTVPISSGSSATFWTATPSGSAALYTEGELVPSGPGLATLFRFDTSTKTSTPVAEHVRGILATSDDLSRIYLISTDALTENQKNSEGAKAQEGQPNLYLDENGSLTFVATLLDGNHGDVAGEKGVGQVYSLGSQNQLFNPARVSSDGSHLVFESRARLTNFDNTDANSGEPDVEVFTYEAGGGLLCISCSASGVRPSGRELPEPYGSSETSSGSNVWAAGWIPSPEHPFYASNVLSGSGGRVFFMSFEPLLPQDTNGAQDVYEWEAPGAGSCREESSAFHKINGGCIYLISSGETPSASTFVGASSDGHDVFFTTESSLLPQDPGNFDLYDARIEGGFAQPTQPAECEGEACQSPPAAPVDATPASSGFEVSEIPHTRCPGGKVRQGKRCVAKKRHKQAKHARHHHHHHHHRSTGHNRRAAR